jgi:hypothetical protein
VIAGLFVQHGQSAQWVDKIGRPGQPGFGLQFGDLAAQLLLGIDRGELGLRK